MTVQLTEVVQPFGDGGFVVNIDGGPFYVLHTEPFNWTICWGSDLSFVMTDAGPAIGLESAEVAIAALLDGAE